MTTTTQKTEPEWKVKAKKEMEFGSYWILEQWWKLSLEELKSLAEEIEWSSQKYYEWIVRFIQFRYASKKRKRRKGG